MKRILNFGYLVACIAMLLSSCQTERHEILSEEETSLSQGSAFLNLVGRAAMHDGSGDDELDQSPCFSVQFPYSVFVNDIEMRVHSFSDLEILLEKFGGSAGGLKLQFPVTLIMANYDRVNVESLEQFNRLQQECAEDVRSGLSPITCASIEFPVQLFVYNTQSQKTNSANVASKQQLFGFLQNQGPNEIISFHYPITLSFSSQSKMEVNNRNEFRSALETCEN